MSQEGISLVLYSPKNVNSLGQWAGTGERRTDQVLAKGHSKLSPVIGFCLIIRCTRRGPPIEKFFDPPDELGDLAEKGVRVDEHAMTSM
jgi:hypothetical protein